MKSGKSKKEKPKENKLKLDPEEIQELKEELAEVDTLKKELGMEQHNPPDAASFSMLLCLRMGNSVDRLGDKIDGIGGKMGFLLGVGTITSALLVAILIVVLNSGGG